MSVNIAEDGVFEFVTLNCVHDAASPTPELATAIYNSMTQMDAGSLLTLRARALGFRIEMPLAVFGYSLM